MQWKRTLVGVGVSLSILGVGFWLGQATAATNDPGTIADPLVSKSYVDEMTLFRVVNLAMGQTVEGDAGTQIIVRAGSTTAVASALGGLIDSTAGTDILQGQPIGLNHLLIIARTDGRGLSAKSDSILMVKGPLRVK